MSECLNPEMLSGNGCFPRLLSVRSEGVSATVAQDEFRLPCLGEDSSNVDRHLVRNDIDALRAWLTHFSSRAATLACYCREVERLLFWALIDRQKPLSLLSADDLARYPSFLADPQPREVWTTARGKRIGRDRLEWRPFAGSLSSSSVRQSLAVVGRLFSWLVDTGYLRHNPMQALYDEPVRMSPALAVPRMRGDFLPLATAALNALPTSTDREREHAERVRWLFALLYHGGLRIPEVSCQTMGAFHIRPLGDSGEWWIAINSTCCPPRLRPASRELMLALVRYRLAQGLPALPQARDPTPLILPIGGRDQHLKPRVLHGIVKTLFLAAASMAGTTGGCAASWLKRGSSDWLRNLSGASAGADGGAVSCDEVDAAVFSILSCGEKFHETGNLYGCLSEPCVRRDARQGQVTRNTRR